MRMIDADKLIEQMTRNLPFKIDTNYESIWGIPIVEAIPISWIDSYITDIDIGIISNNPLAIRKLVDDWRAENENYR